VSAKGTFDLLKRAMNSYKIKSILSDGGTENNNHLVKRLVIGKNTNWKNAMIESVFAAIKRKRRDFQSETIPEVVMDYVHSNY